MTDLLTILHGNALDKLRAIPDASVQCVCTSPPYWGLRDYNDPEQIGLERTYGEYIEKLVAVFREVRRVLKHDGTFWLNLGDCYSESGKGGNPGDSPFIKQASNIGSLSVRARIQETELSAKNLVMIPARVALALQSDGWYLRSQIPWVKRPAMPESVEDRPNSAVEYVFLLTKSERYYYNCAAVKVLAQSGPSDVRKMLEKKERIDAKHFHDDPGPLAAANPATNIGKKRGVGGTVVNKNETSADRRTNGFNVRWDEAEATNGVSMLRNWRNSDQFYESVSGLLGDESGDPLAFCVNPQPFRGAHFAAWPPKLVQPMILAGSRAGDTVLDPFFGSGTTGKVALELGRRCIGIELNAEYIAIARQRCETTVGLPL